MLISFIEIILCFVLLSYPLILKGKDNEFDKDNYQAGYAWSYYTIILSIFLTGFTVLVDISRAKEIYSVNEFEN